MCFSYLKTAKCSHLKCVLVTWKLLSVVTSNVYMLPEIDKCSHLKMVKCTHLKCILVTWKLLSVVTSNAY